MFPSLRIRAVLSFITVNTTTGWAKKARSYSLIFLISFFLHKVQSSKSSFFHISTRSPVELKDSTYADLVSRGLSAYLFGID